LADDSGTGKIREISIYYKTMQGNMHLQMKAFLRLCVEGMRLENKFINFGVRSG